MKLCTVCGIATSRGKRCGKHPERSGPSHPVHVDPRWTRLSKRMIARHVGEQGWQCPGDGPEHLPHPTHDLTLDHVIPVIEGGPSFDPGNTRVLCRSRNSELGARLTNARRAGRTTPRIAPVLDERAQLRARFLG